MFVFYFSILDSSGNAQFSMIHKSPLCLVKYCYLSVEMVMEVTLLVLCTQHVHNFAVLWGASGALCLAFSITFKAVLVEGMTAQKVN